MDQGTESPSYITVYIHSFLPTPSSPPPPTRTPISMFKFFSIPTSNTCRETLVALYDANTLFNLARLTLSYKFPTFPNFQCRPRCAVQTFNYSHATGLGALRVRESI